MESTFRKDRYPGNNPNHDLPFESPQTEESARLHEKRRGEKRSGPAVERKNKNPDDEGKVRGGNHSANQV